MMPWLSMSNGEFFGFDNKLISNINYDLKLQLVFMFFRIQLR